VRALRNRTNNLNGAMPSLASAFCSAILIERISNMKQTIKVTIESAVGAGKSSLAFALEDICRQHGVECNIDGCEDEIPGAMEESWPKRLRSITDKSEVQITTRQLNRSISQNVERSHEG